MRVRLKDHELTCHIEITPGPLLVYARKISGMGGLPPNTAGRMTCLLSGGYDSAVAAYHMMKRGAHLSFVHFYGGGAQPGESSLHIASGLVRTLVWNRGFELHVCLEVPQASEAPGSVQATVDLGEIVRREVA